MHQVSSSAPSSHRLEQWACGALVVAEHVVLPSRHFLRVLAHVDVHVRVCVYVHAHGRDRDRDRGDRVHERDHDDHDCDHDHAHAQAQLDQDLNQETPRPLANPI